MGIEYLGDSVYVEGDNWGLELTTNNGYADDPRNVIFLEPRVWSALVDYVKRLEEIGEIDGQQRQASEDAADQPSGGPVGPAPSE